MKTPTEIEQRLAEIEAERGELAAIDFDAEMRQATIDGGDLDGIEQRQADAERKERRLRIEAEALEDHLPEARRMAAKPQIDDVHRRLAEREDQARKAAEKARKAVAALHQAMDDFSQASTTSDLRSELGTIAKEIDASLEGIGSISHTVLAADLGTLQAKLGQWVTISTTRAARAHGDPATIDVSKAA
ncbi:hypothetical protein [Halomonas sp. CSM-2]|uniref:hypothetical protein n=1 Tax=Halomonas sp. CSM-2 TaxID=1975722 RepID=UPI000A280D7C|nr:hypothetical protein [Halomonas sp. CSM-2]